MVDGFLGEGEPSFLTGMAPSVSRPHSSGWPHTQKYVASTNWSLWGVTFLQGMWEVKKAWAGR